LRKNGEKAGIKPVYSKAKWWNNGPTFLPTIPMTSNTSPTYTTRISLRAKRISIRVLANNKVELVVPRGASIKQAERFLHSKKGWIEQALQQSKHLPQATLERPSTIHLRGINQRWSVQYGQQARLKEHGDQLLIPQADMPAAQQQLTRWLHDKAHTHLVPWLRSVSDELALPFNRVTVRAQKTRWGSCSAKHNININRNLLFLEPEVVRYLFVHELCHTVHLNHSHRYWATVAQYEPNYPQYDRQLRKAMLDIPVWAHP